MCSKLMALWSLGLNTTAPTLLALAIAFPLPTDAAAWTFHVRQQPADSLARARAVYMENKVAEALPLFQAVASKEPNNAEAHAWLAEAARRLGQFDRAEESARIALRLVPCHAFAHNVLGDLYRPQVSQWHKVNADSAWKHLMRAAECDTTDGNPWASIWGEAERRADSLMERRAVRRLVETGFLTPSVLAYSRWVLEGLPNDALLFTAGDLDTWGVLAVQTVERLRTDVAVVNTWQLNLDWYPPLVRKRDGLPLPTLPPSAGDASEAIRSFWRAKSLDGTLGRPIAATAPQPTGPGQFAFAGSSWRLTARDYFADSSVIRRAFESLHDADLALPAVSANDRSPVRRTKWIGYEVAVATAFRYASILDQQGHKAEATRTEAWARDFGRRSGLSAESVAILRRFALETSP